MVIRNIYKTPMSPRTLNQPVTNEAGLRLFDRTFHGNGDRRTIKYHGRVYFQFLHRETPFAIHRRPIDNLPAFLDKRASQRSMESCYTLQEVRRSFPLREAFLCILAETENLSWAVLINVKNGNIINARQFTKGKQLALDEISSLTEGATILSHLLSQGIINEDGIIQSQYYENLPSLIPSIELLPQDIGLILRLFGQAQWAKAHDRVPRRDILRQIANIVPWPKYKSLQAAMETLTNHSNIGHTILHYPFYPEENHEQAWDVFPSMFSITNRGIKANQQVIRRTILMFRRFHKLLSEA